MFDLGSEAGFMEFAGFMNYRERQANEQREREASREAQSREQEEQQKK